MLLLCCKYSEKFSVFSLQAKTEKLKVFRFPLSVFSLINYLCEDYQKTHK